MKILLSGTPALLVVLLLCSCEKEEVAAPDPRPVVTFTVAEPTPTLERTFSGQLKSAEGVGIAFEVTGRVLEVRAQAGRRYEENDVLAQMDTSSYQSQLNDARAQLVQAEQELRRTQSLFENANASKSQLDSAIAREGSARANFNLIEKRVNDCTLRMPYGGVIGSVSVDAQQVVNTGQTVMTIQGEGYMEFKIGVPAEVISNVSEGMEAQVSLGSLPGRLFVASVSEVSPQVDQNTTYPVTLVLNGGHETIRAGMDGEATLTFPNPLGLTLRVPVSSVTAGPGNRQFVWIVEPDSSGKTATVAQREVKVGSLRGEAMIEITSGLRVGETILSRGANLVQDGLTVSLVTPENNL